MSIVINIKPEFEKELVRSAEALGISLDAFVAGVLEEAAHVNPNRAENQTIEEFERSLDRIAQFSSEIPVLPDKALSREGIYQDHDGPEVALLPIRHPIVPLYP